MNCRFFGWGNLQHRPSRYMHKTKLPRRQQRVHRILHLRPRHEIAEQRFQLPLLHRNHAIQIFRQQRRQRLRHRKPNAFFHHLRRPTRKQIPRRPFARRIIHPRHAQLRPQFAQRLIQRGQRKRFRPAPPASSASKLGPARVINSNASQASAE